MNTDWSAFLAARGTPGANGDTATDCTRYDLSHLGLIVVQGADADGFLQGQLTNDIRTLSADHCQLTAHCSPKGRMLDLFLALRLPDGIGLQLPRERVAPALKRLGLYVLRSKVTLLEHSDGPVRIGLAGTGAARALERLGLPVPEQDFDMATADAVTVLRLPGTAPRFELIAECARQIDLWDALAPVSAWGDADDWALLDLRAGIPCVYTATSDAFVPQMANLQLLNGVSFTKGCYTGQEVVARMQYLGTLKRRMYWAEVETQTPPQPGDALESPASTSEQGAGRVVDARRRGDGRYELLAVVEIAVAETGEVRLGVNGPQFKCQAPPYGFQTPVG